MSRKHMWPGTLGQVWEREKGCTPRCHFFSHSCLTWWSSLLKEEQTPSAAVTLILTRHLWLLSVGENGSSQSRIQINSYHWCNICEMLLGNWKHYWIQRSWSTCSASKFNNRSGKGYMVIHLPITCKKVSKGHTCILRIIYYDSRDCEHWQVHDLPKTRSNGVRGRSYGMLPLLTQSWLQNKVTSWLSGFCSISISSICFTFGFGKKHIVQAMWKGYSIFTSCQSKGPLRHTGRPRTSGLQPHENIVPLYMHTAQKKTLKLEHCIYICLGWRLWGSHF